MKPNILLNRADSLRLQTYLENDSSKPRPDAVTRSCLEEILRHSHESEEPQYAESHAGLNRPILLVCENDPEDFYSFIITLPDEADLETDHISILRPISLSVLGRKAGESVEWETPAGMRKMQIISVMNSKEATLAS